MPAPLTNGAPKWDGTENLNDFVYRLEHHLEESGITDEKKKMKWALAYVDYETRQEYMSFPEANGEWKNFKEKLRVEYPELNAEEIGSVAQMRKLTAKHRGISVHEKEKLLSFRRKFLTLAEKCAKPPAVMSNRELVEAFMGALDEGFKEQLNIRLSLTGTLRNANTAHTLRKDDPYEYTEVVAKAVDLVSRRAMMGSSTLATQGSLVDSNSRTVSILKRETPIPSAVHMSTEIETVHQELNQLKDTLQINQKSVQGSIDALKATIATQASNLRNESSYRSGGQFQNNQRSMEPRQQGCFYCGEDHRWVTCPHKAQDERDGKIKIDGNKVRFANGTGIPRDPGATIRDSVRKYLPVTVALQIYGGIDQELEPDTGTPNVVDTTGVATASSFMMGQPVTARDLEIERLKGQVAGMQAMMQGLQLKGQSAPSPAVAEENEENDEIMALQALTKILAQAKKDGARKQGF
ncbi:hypothetical protein AGABI1DRAFT_130726 [Agaricus bisporus var. burnettii JB137-S8]|uniref:Retrotransposon gag domain-containing protein n=1 Tax=Agaricus bisporus var. burnettii (strain JB137-S8 / ATCC MYA-4627 / FGSC 10392) TaxID=597362 RepID=K5XQD3_AGABU|nr:uncharacterized protein AGABI1DRAFT_130726 [Agaricus bisporus var. burnettii JB137-S8]EKM77000.1 hypothetical protein AGABI1DRAFT_130726 [Agaricus bisporus var. burnettii JB137-S8]